MPELDISSEKVAWIIVRAREYEAKVAAFDDGDPETADEEGVGILENRADDATLRELTGFFRTLNTDEEVALVALAWVGRGTFTADEWDEALATARAERDTRTERYLLGMPLLADHLEAGLDALGISPAEAEEDLG
jgi:hypothetical protein